MRKFQVVWRKANDQRGLLNVSNIKATNSTDAARKTRRNAGDKIFVLAVKTVRSSAVGSF